MSYATAIEQENVEQQFLCILRPRVIVSGFTHYSGNIWSVPFALGEVFEVFFDNLFVGRYPDSGYTDLASIATFGFVWDPSTNILYVSLNGVDPNTYASPVVTYSMYLSTLDAYWHGHPDDDSTRVVYYEPLIEKSPSLNSQNSEVFLGFLPVQRANISLVNTTEFFNEHIYASSFNQAEALIYHWVDELTIDNVKLIFHGVTSNISYVDQRINLVIYDRFDFLDQEFRYPALHNFYSTAAYPSMDPNFNGRPIRYAYGQVEGFVPVVIDYNNTSPAPGDNRRWLVGIFSQGNTATLPTSRTVPASPASTTTRTYLNIVTPVGMPFVMGDSVWLDRVVGTDEYLSVTAIGSNYIEHTALAGGAMASGDSVKRHKHIGNVTIIQNGLKYYPMYGRDYVDYYPSTGFPMGFELSSSMESNIGIPATFSPNDRIYCRLYGDTGATALALFGGLFTFPADDMSMGGTLTNGIAIIYALMKIASIVDTDIDLASFQSLSGTVTDPLGFAIPATTSENFPTLKNLFAQLCQTLLLRVYLDENRDWTIKQIGPLSTYDYTIDDTEILKESFSYEFDYKDLVSNVIIEYGAREVADEVSRIGGSVRTISAQNNTTIYLHGTKKQKTFQSLHFKSAQAQVLARRLSYLLGERRGVARVKAKNRFLPTLIGDTIQVSRTRLPGFPFDSDTERTRKFVTNATDRGLAEIVLTLDDQKGIEDNSGSW